MPNRFAGIATQDWDSIVLNKPKPKTQDLRDPKAVNKALRTGAQVETVKKHTARKLDAAAEPAALERVATEVRQVIQKARMEKKMSQAELAKQINERTQVVQEYENGKAVPNQIVLGKMEKVLGVKLRGKANNHK